MTTLFGALRIASGLSLEEAAAFLEVRRDTVQSWTTGRRQAPPVILEQMRLLIIVQHQMEERLAAANVPLPSDVWLSMDRPAQFPTDSSWSVVMGRVWARQGPAAVDDTE